MLFTLFRENKFWPIVLIVCVRVGSGIRSVWIGAAEWIGLWATATERRLVEWTAVAECLTAIWTSSRSRWSRRAYVSTMAGILWRWMTRWRSALTVWSLECFRVRAACWPSDFVEVRILKGKCHHICNLLWKWSISALEWWGRCAWRFISLYTVCVVCLWIGLWGAVRNTELRLLVRIRRTVCLVLFAVGSDCVLCACIKWLPDKQNRIKRTH